MTSDYPEWWSPADLERLGRWRASLIEQLGQDLRRCCEYMYPDPAGLAILCRVSRRYGAPEWVRTALRLYWSELQRTRRD